MENKKQVGSSSSFTTELFGPKDTTGPSSSTGVFASIFSTPSMAAARNFANQPAANKVWSAKQATPDNIAQNGESVSNSVKNKGRRSIFQEGTEPSCPMSSSLYYGGQEDMYIRSSSHQTPTNSYNNFKKDEGEDDPNGNASRGNWWQGSVYY